MIFILFVFKVVGTIMKSYSVLDKILKPMPWGGCPMFLACIGALQRDHIRKWVIPMPRIFMDHIYAQMRSVSFVPGVTLNIEDSTSLDKAKSFSSFCRLVTETESKMK